MSGWNGAVDSHTERLQGEGKERHMGGKDIGEDIDDKKGRRPWRRKRMMKSELVDHKGCKVMVEVSGEEVYVAVVMVNIL